MRFPLVRSVTSAFAFCVGVLLHAGGCFTEPTLAAAFCYSTADGATNERGPAGEASHVLVTQLGFDEVEEPATFAECSLSHSAKAVWEDSSGELVFLSSYFAGPNHHLPTGVLNDLQGAQLSVSVLSRTERAMAITRDGAPVLAAFISVPLETLAVPGLNVWLQLPSTLPNANACGTQVEVALMVGDDDAVVPTTIPNGSVENVTVDGRTLTIANVRSLGAVTTNSQGGWCPEESDKDDLVWSLSVAE